MAECSRGLQSVVMEVTATNLRPIGVNGLVFDGGWAFCFSKACSLQCIY